MRGFPGQGEGVNLNQMRMIRNTKYVVGAASAAMGRLKQELRG
jgi:hypothetical protein